MRIVGRAGSKGWRPVTVFWSAIMEGGIQVNSEGRRFSDESRGYSEQAVDVGRQPDGFAWTIYDGKIDAMMQEIAEYRDVRSAGALLTAGSIAELAEKLKVPVEALEQTISEVLKLKSEGGQDRFGRTFDPEHQIFAPYVAVKVHPALFHTQGGLVVDAHARVTDQEGAPLPNLFAGGGAARGVSGSGASGYVAGNGLMTATTLGRLAGETAAAQARTMQGSPVPADSTD